MKVGVKSLKGSKLMVAFAKAVFLAASMQVSRML
jgi:hypothetical protein